MGHDTNFDGTFSCSPPLADKDQDDDQEEKSHRQGRPLSPTPKRKTTCS